jgi:hypothetical protein
MRRILSMLLLFVFALPLVAPALGQTAQQRLLLCCRKGGAHHCTASATMEDGSPAPTFRAHCSACPKPAVASHAADSLAVGQVANAASVSISPLRIRQVEAGYRISFHRSRQKRGPPVVVLS